MLVKSYFVAKVEEAMASAVRDLGGDALLVSTRKTAPEQAHLGNYEVVFATGVPAAPLTTEDAALPDKPAAPAPLAVVREQLEAVRRTLGVPSAAQAGMREQLEECGLDPQLASELLAAAIPAEGTASWKSSASRWLAEKLAPLQGRSPSIEAGQTLLLAGPSGRGKSTVFAKLALHLAAQANLPLRLLRLEPGTGRTPAPIRHDGLRDTPLQTVAALSELRSALNRPFAGVTLVDMPGPGAGGLPEAGIASLCRNLPGVRVHLVLRADATTANQQLAISRFRHCSPAALIFTGVDEVAVYGPLGGVALAAKLPVSFLSAGQKIDDEFEIATAARLAELAIHGPRIWSRAAA